MPPLHERTQLVLASCGETGPAMQRTLWELATRLSPARYDMRAWLPDDAEHDDLARALEPRGVPVDRMPSARPRWDWPSRLKLWLKLRRSRPDLVHLHAGRFAEDRLPAALDGAETPRLVLTTPLARHDEGLGAPYRRIAAIADAITVPTLASGETLARAGVSRSRIRLVPPGLDAPDEEAEWEPAKIVRERLRADALHPLWVCVGSLEPHKGQAVFLDALAELKRRGLLFTAAIVGSGPTRADLEAKIAALDLGAVVRILEPVDDFGPLLLAADVVVVPSLEDVLPRPLLEALVRGRPVVASAVGAIPEVVGEGAGGLLVPPGDANAIAEALEQLHRRRDFGFRLGATAARRLREDLAWDRVVDAYEAVYDEVVGLASFVPEPMAGGHARR